VRFSILKVAILKEAGMGCPPFDSSAPKIKSDRILRK